MKLYAEFDDGKRVELREIQGLQPNCEIVFIRTATHLPRENTEVIESHMSGKIGKKVVLLDSMFGEVFVI
jgi:hypothetical protein